MLVDFHGEQEQVTMTRTWPNMISGEGVRGMEWRKWSADAEPKHNVALPFTRMFLGPMDYTPGAMRNATRASFAPLFQQPWPWGRAAINWRCMSFSSPLCRCSRAVRPIICTKPEVMDFLGPVPSVWDDTRALGGRISEYVLVARCSGNDSYVGAMSDWTAR